MAWLIRYFLRNNLNQGCLILPVTVPHVCLRCTAEWHDINSTLQGFILFTLQFSNPL